MAYGVKIQVRTRIQMRQGVMEVFLDDQVVIHNLLADYNTEIKAIWKRLGVTEKPSLPRSSRANVGIWIALFLAFFIFFKWLERHAF